MRHSGLPTPTAAHIAAFAMAIVVATALAAGLVGSPYYPAGAAPSGQPSTAPSAGSSPDQPVRPVEAEGSIRSRGGRDAAQPESAQADAVQQRDEQSAQAGASESEQPASPADTPPLNIRVGIQAGHWKASEQAAELASLRGSTGAQGNGWREVDINLDIAKRVAALLESRGITVDLIPATIPIQYAADAFVALHGDANSNTTLSGYKLARSSRSSIPSKDDALLNAISQEYAAATGLPFHAATITVNMTSYYAFANQGIRHSIAPTTPGVILEMGFLTTPKDRKLLMEQPDVAAQGIASGILRFLGL